jgi:hypothetical protein
MRIISSIALVVLFMAFVNTAGAQAPWWKRNNLRVIQVNLPAYEAATLNADSLVHDLVENSANTVIINAGGIMAFYPTKLPFHYTNPYMKPHTLGEVVDKCHKNNVKVIVRFDFSRVHESIYKQHPDWCYISPDGERIINTDMYVVSINGPYVQQHAFSIIDEVLQLYPVDGIFLNMPGYQVRNPYENKYHGIDQNEFDKAAFKKFSGKSLPLKEDRNDSVYTEYLEFKKQSVEDWSRRLYEMIHKRSDQIAICTYSDKYVDIIRHEAQTNSLPYWPYTSSDNVSNAVNSYPSHVISNASIQQISFQSRYNAVEPEETAIRLYENIANGSGLDMSMMGDMRGYEDERNFSTFRRVYGFHKKNEKYYGDYTSISKIAVIAPGAWPSGDPMQEYRGVQLMLKEAHVQFDIIEDGQIENLHDKLRNYKLIILPDITYLSKNAITVLQQLARSGVHLLATNRSFSDNPSVLKELFGATAEKSETDGSGHYLDVSDHALFPGLRQQTMVFLKFNLGMYKFDEGSKMMLPVLTKGRPGPPEIIGGHEPSDYYACSMRDYGKGRTVLMPLNIGKLYFLHGYEQHKNIVLDVIRQVYPQAFEDLVTDAHERVEIIAKDFRFNDGTEKKKKLDGRIVHFVNITGFSGNTYFKPHVQRNITFTMKMPFRPSKAYTLTNKRPVEFNYVNGSVSATLRDLGEYEAVVFER